MNGLRIDYECFTACHTFEIACQQERGFAPEKLLEKGRIGISPYEIGPHNLDDSMHQYEFLPAPTALCDMCADRVAKSKESTCVRHCQAGCMHYGSVEELPKKTTSKKMTPVRVRLIGAREFAHSGTFPFCGGERRLVACITSALCATRAAK